jgi:hypothetical protein
LALKPNAKQNSPILMDCTRSKRQSNFNHAVLFNSELVKDGFQSMTYDLQQPLPEPNNPPVSPVVISPPPKKSRKNLWIILGIAVSLLCFGSIICVSVIAFGAGKVAAEKAPVEAILDSYMNYMAAKDPERAYALFSPRAQRQIPISEIQEWIEGNNYILFEGYQSLSVQNLNINFAINTNPDVPQGTVAEVTGIISYEHGIQGTFNGILEKVEGNWQIDGIFVNIPPDKFQP